MLKKILSCVLAIVVIASKSQITYSMAIPNPIPEYNGTYENFGQNHFFYPNAGEIRYSNIDRPSATAVKYYTQFTSPREYLLSNNNISFVFSKHDTVGIVRDSLHRIDLEMFGQNAGTAFARIDTQNTCVLNYFTNWFGSSGRTGVKGGASIACQSIWNNIDMVYTSNNTGLKIFYIVYPGGDPNQIVWKINGAKSNYINATKLTLEANWARMSFNQPKMYQYTIASNIITPFNVGSPTWQNLGSNKFTLASLAGYDNSLPLIIEITQGPATNPSINSLKWSTYFGGDDTDYMFRINSDANNNLYGAGQTVSPDFPQNVNSSPWQGYVAGYEAFLSKFSAAGVLQWATYAGGSSSEYIKDIDFTTNDVFSVGHTESWDFPTIPKTGAYNNNSPGGGNGDGFILQLDKATGGSCSWSTFFGGNGGEELRGCKFDGSGNLFVVGSSNSTNLTVTGPSGSYQQSYNSAQQVNPFPAPDIHDAIIMRFAASTSALNWFTFFGTSAGGINANNNFDDEFWDIDISGTDIYACGFAGGTNLPSSVNSKMLSGSSDGILAKFSTSGVLSASKYTNGNIRNHSVRVNRSKVYTCGYSKNGATNVNSGSYFYDNTCASNDYDACFSVHSLNLSTTIHNTFLGGTGVDNAFEMQFAPNGVFYITGETYASNFPITTIANTYNMSQAGGNDNFIAAFQETRTNIVWSTCLGSSTNETNQQGEGTSLAIDGQNFLHLGGCSDSYSGFPLDNGLGIPYFQSVRAGNAQSSSPDATITRFDLTTVNILVGLEDFKGTSFSFGLYPNPTAQYLTIDNPELLNQNLRYAVYNSAGQKLKEGNIQSGEKQIDVSVLHSGVYFINVSNGTRTFTNKFIKVDN